MKNKNAFPKTLIQIHYHDRPCGVMNVIRHYARAFSDIMQAGSGNNILVCEKHAQEKYPEFPGRSIVGLSLAGYRTFASKRRFFDEREKIIAGIASLLLAEETRTPVAVMAHNLTLCKNAALVSAFAELARSFASPKNNYRFFSVAHDFAQEGRVEQLAQINKLENLGIAIRDDIAALRAPVRFLAIHPRAEGTLGRAGFNVSLLVNSVSPEPVSGRGRNAIKEVFVKRLADYSIANRIAFKPGKPIVLSPARTIARKNPFEAIALACIANDANLLVGGAGSSAADKKRHARIQQLAKEYHLPVITDIRDLVSQSKPLRKFAGNNPMLSLYAGSDRVLSCAVTEGFGYLLHEPWLYDTPVFGRKPIGIDAVGKMSGKNYYDFLPIPAEWVNTSVVKMKYLAIADKCFSESNQRKRFKIEVEKRLKQEFLDFALLDEETQISVIKKLISSELLRKSWRALLENPVKGWPGLSAFSKEIPRSVIRENKTIIGKQFSMEKFIGEFERCIGIIPKAGDGKVDWKIVVDEYGAVEGFRIR